MKKIVSTAICMALLLMAGCAATTHTVTQKIISATITGNEFPSISYVIEVEDESRYTVTKEVFDAYDIGDEYIFTESRGDEKF